MAAVISGGGPLFTDKKPIEDYEATSGQAFGAAAGSQADRFNIFSNIVRQAQSIGGGLQALAGEEPFLTPDQARAEAEKRGVKWDGQSNVSQTEFDIIVSLKERERARESVLMRRPQTMTGAAAEFAGGLAGSFADPVNIAASLIPVVGQARYAMWLERAGSAASRFGVRAGVGALSGAVGTAALEPLMLFQQNQLQMEYGLADSFLNVTFGTIMGGGIHSIGGAIGDAFQRRTAANVGGEPPEFEPYRPDDATERAMLEAAVTAADNGADINPRMVFDTAATNDAVTEISRLRKQLDRVDAEEARALRLAEKSDVSGARVSARDVLDRAQVEIDTLSGEIRASRARADAAIDDVTPQRLQAIDAELSSPGINAVRRAELEAERRLITEGAARTPEQDALERARAEQEATALEKAKTRAEKDAIKAQAKLDRLTQSETIAARELSAAGARISSRRDDVQQLVARTLRRWAGATGDRLSRAEAAALAGDLLRLPRDGFETTLRQLLGSRAPSGEPAIRPDTYDPASGYEPPEVTQARGDADAAARRMDDGAEIDGEIEGFAEMLDMARARGTLSPEDQAALDLADEFIRKTDIRVRATRAAAACILGVA